MAELYSLKEWQQMDLLLSQSDFDDLPPAQMPTMVSTCTTNTVETTCPAVEETRFVQYSSDEATNFIDSMENCSTRKKTDSDIRQFRSFLNFKGEDREIENLPILDLDRHFGYFILGARKAKDSCEYEPSSLRGFMSSLDRYLKRKGWTNGVTKNPLFPHSNAALTAKQKDLKSKGLGNKPNESDELTDADIEMLFQQKIIGTHSPEALINLLHLNFSLVLGMRGGKEQRQLKWGDLEVGKDEDGDEFLVHKKERTTKTRTGQDIRNIRQFKPKAWNNMTDSRCPVKAYKVYAENRPKETLNPDAPFFLSINVRNPMKGQLWFKNQPMGVNTIYGLTKNMWQKCHTKGDSRKITNHSIRKHFVQKGVDLNLPPTETIQISGHKNLTSVNNYSKMNIQKQKHVAKALTSNTCTTTLALPQVNQTNTTTPATCTSTTSLESYPAYNTSASRCTNLSYSQQALSSVFGAHTIISGGNFYFGNTGPSPSTQPYMKDTAAPTHNQCTATCIPQPGPSPSTLHETKLQESPSPPLQKYRRILPIHDSDDDDFI